MGRSQHLELCLQLTLNLYINKFYVYCTIPNVYKMCIGRFSVTDEAGELGVFDDVLCVAVPLEKCWKQI